MPAAKQQLNPQALWQFSLSVYPKVKPLCLQWQNTLAANVNVLLALCYAEQLGLSICAIKLKQSLAQLTPLNSKITQPLRQCRQILAELPLTSEQQTQLKQSILATELHAEQIEQQLLCNTLYFTASNTPDNLTLYLQYLHITLNPKLAANIVDLRQASIQILAKQPPNY